MTVSAVVVSALIVVATIALTSIAASASIGKDVQDDNSWTSALFPFAAKTSVINYDTNTIKINGGKSADEENLEFVFDVFKNEYLSADGKVIIKGDNNEKVVAPGASVVEDEAAFTIENVGDTEATCDLDFYCEFNSSEIPLNFKLIDPEGNYLLGSESEYDDALKINDVDQSQTLSPGQKLTYHFP